jgi:hypothetical protein
MTTISQNKYDVTPDNKQELANSLCKKYSSNPIIALDADDILKVIGNAAAIAVTEANGDNIAEIAKVFPALHYASRLAFVINLKEKEEMIMRDLQAVADWISGLIDDIEVIWSICKNNTIPNLFQVAIISANE